MAEQFDLSSELDSHAEMEINMLVYDMAKRRKSIWKSSYMEKRRSHGEFTLTSEFSDSRFRNYFRLNRIKFNEVHSIIESKIYSEGCNTQIPMGTKEKLAVFLG
ncbi:hypothetical protein NQ314_016947 [Rhamnusium bicolor]|uniref:Uncharacterized protein n=1 Tax=Rhamnusium bicolor TaxID=1586634 RepID=A0AAV8WUH9_9CUCU|nr:hypothetical protein NQ314_016947 [Rhamnusium bicolor]